MSENDKEESELTKEEREKIKRLRDDWKSRKHTSTLPAWKELQTLGIDLAKLGLQDVDEETSDPMTALAQYYVADRPSCPRWFGEYPRRFDFIKEMIREFKVDGVVAERLTFCDLWGLEQYQVGKDLKEEGIPYLMLEREYLLGGIGQTRTRVQAFLETMGR